MTPIRIEDPDDPRIAAYRDIRERDLKGRDGLFIAEGKVVLHTLFAARRFAVESILLLENRLAGMQETLAMAPPGAPLYIAAAEVLDRIAGFHLHRGVLALGRRRATDEPASLLRGLPDDALVAVLVGIANHDNVGGVFRNAAAFGVDAVLLDSTCCDPLYRKAVRVSVGACLKIPYAIADAAALPDELAAAGFEQWALSPAGSRDIRVIRPSGRVAVYLGAEGSGLPAGILDRVGTVRIGMAEGFDSLNVAAASAIALHHLAHLRRG